MNVFLIGFMACGKNSLGKRLAAKNPCPVSDTDRAVEEVFGMRIPQIFQTYGEERFREEERKALQALADDNRLVITGGGLPCFFDNMEYMNRKGITIYLQVPPGIIASRLAEDTNRLSRPLLQHMDKEKIPDFVRQSLQEREFFYRQAHYRFQPCTEEFSVLQELVERGLSSDSHTAMVAAMTEAKEINPQTRN